MYLELGGFVIVCIVYYKYKLTQKQKQKQIRDILSQYTCVDDDDSDSILV